LAHIVKEEERPKHYRLLVTCPSCGEEAHAVLSWEQVKAIYSMMQMPLSKARLAAEQWTLATVGKPVKIMDK